MHMKNIIIAIVVIVVLALGYWWWQNQQMVPASQTATENTLIEGEVNGAVAEPQWDAVGKDGAAAQ